MKKLLLTFSLIALTSTINAQWTAQNSGFTAAYRGLSEIHALDANTVWALAYDGSGGGANVQELTMTTDGGSLWTMKTIDLGDPTLQINNISPVSATTAWVSAIVNIGSPNPTDGVGTIVKTSDGGESWTPQCATCFQIAGSSFLNGVHFFNENVGVAYGDPVGGEYEIWRTTNGGDSWTQVAGANIANPLSGEYGYNSLPIAAGGTLWFPTNKGRLVRTTDMGATWTAAQAPLTDFGAALPANSGTAIFSDANNGYLLKTSGTVATPVYTYYITTNGGATWGTGATFTGTRRILTYIPGTTTIVATSQQVTPTPTFGTSVSINNGATWTDVESAEQRGASSFVNLTTGWSAGFSDIDPLVVDGIYKLTGTLGLDNSTTVSKFKVYPNPASSTVTISVENVDSFNLTVTDLTGKVVMAKSLSGMENTLDISSLSTGAYFFELTSDNKKDVVKILKN
ncbi:MAG: T9SS type A sorting domain-containing protein [Bacteroidota bacterium]